MKRTDSDSNKDSRKDNHKVKQVKISKNKDKTFINKCQKYAIYVISTCSVDPN